MSNEEKILAMLTQMQGTIDHMQGDISQMQGTIDHMQGDISQMQGTIDHMQGDISQMQGTINHMQGDISQMQGTITGIKLRLELDIEKRFDAVNQSIDAIEKRLDVLDEVKALSEETQERVEMIHSVVVRHSQDITELKQAQ